MRPVDVTMVFRTDEDGKDALGKAAEDVIKDVVAVLERRTKLIIEHWHVHTMWADED